MSSETITINFINAMLAGDEAVMQEMLDANVIWYPPTSVAAHFHGQVVGRGDVVKFLTENPAKFYEPGSRRAEIINTAGNDQYASVNFNFIASPKKGGTLSTCANFMFEFSGSKITRAWEVLDMAEWNSAVL